MIPYFEQPSFSVGPLTIHAFGVLVAVSLLVGLKLAERRFGRLGLDAALGERMGWWLLAGGILAAHLFALLFYFPHRIMEEPLSLLRIWDPISSFGGILGGIAGVWLFFHLRARDLPSVTRLAYLDVAAFVFPVSLMIGRVGCALAHDHPGIVTSFPLSVSLATDKAQQYIRSVYAEGGRALDASPGALSQLGFLDLGLLEFLYLAVVVVPVVLLMARRPRAPGFFLALFVLTYMPARFALDFLRVADARYAGLTPAQWVALVALLTLATLRLRGGTRVALFALTAFAIACGARA